MNIKQKLEQQLQTIVPGATLSVSDKADFQCNAVFALAKQQKTNPMVLANQIAEQWNTQFGDTAVATAVNGFINFTINDQLLGEIAQWTVDNQRLPLASQPPRTVFFDYGGANIAKELHIGHLRSPIIGEALKRVFQAFGHRTIAGVYLGDWGLQMGLVLAEIIDRGLDVNQVTLAMLGEIYPSASQRKKTDPAFYERASTITAKLQDLEEPYYSMYQVLRQLSVTQIKKNYDKLNCTFDLYDGESTYKPQVATVMDQLRTAGLLHESQGVLVVDVAQPTDQKPMPPIVLQKQNGGYLYATSDITAIYTRYREYHPDQIIYFTDARQSLHFEQVFRAVRLAKLIPDNVTLTHVPYGTINGADGKPFKTRDGGTIKLEDILDTVSAATTEFAVGLSAIKFADLINNVAKDYVFDLQKCVSFEGKTGPYILYTIVRINSIFEKVGTVRDNFQNFAKYVTPVMRDLVMKVVKLTEAYSVAMQSLSLHPIADAMYQLANSFSTFYATYNISNESDPAKKELLLSLAGLTKTALSTALNTLAIDTVDKM